MWQAARVADVQEWLVKVIQAMYVGATGRTHVNTFFTEKFES